MTLASTLVDGEILNASIVGAVFSIVIVLEVSMVAPSVSTLEAVHTMVSVGLFSAGLMVYELPFPLSGLPSANVHV